MIKHRRLRDLVIEIEPLPLNAKAPRIIGCRRAPAGINVRWAEESSQ